MSLRTFERHRLLELSRQVDDATDQLWAAGKLALVLRLLFEDGQRLVGELRALPNASSSELSSLDALCRQGSLLGLPILERELTPAHEELLGHLAISRRRCIEQLLKAEPRTRRSRHALGLLLAVAVICSGSYAMFRNARTASASGTYSRDFPASQAIDGLKTTEWLLPDGETGWLQLGFTRPRDVEAVRLRNAVNGHYGDRAAKSVKVEAYQRTRVVATASAEFPAVGTDKGPVTVRIAAREVTHLRVHIESFHGRGGGLAEVEVE